MTADLAAIARGLAALAVLRVASVALDVATACTMGPRSAAEAGGACLLAGCARGREMANLTREAP